MSTIRPRKPAVSPGGIAGGDLSGDYPSPSVNSIQGFPFSDTDPQDGQILTWNGSAWAPGTTAATGTGGGGILYYLNSDISPDIPTSGLGAPTIKELGLVASIPQGTFSKNNISTGGTYDEVIGFVTDVGNPGLTAIPAGIWDFNFWASSTAVSASDISVRIKLYTYDGSTTTLVKTSGVAPIFEPTVTKQYTCSMVIPETIILNTTRLYLVLEATSQSSGLNISFYFGDSTPSYVLTTIPSIRGTGIVHVVNGAVQNPATAINLASSDVTGVLPIANGGTGLSSTPSNGQLLIGNGSGFTEATLTQGSGISISNGSGTITVANSGVLSVGGSAPIASSGGSTPTLSLNDSGVAAGSYGSASSIPSITVTAKGIVSSASSSSVAIDASQITSGTLPVARGGTGISSAGAAGNVLISDGTNLISRSITGDVSLTSTGATTVVAVRNAPVSATPPTTNDILVYNGTSWVPSSIISTLQVSYQTVLATEAITAGDVVYIVNSGGSGSSPSVARAQANSISTIRGVIGFATTNIAKNAQGTVQTYGQLIGPVNTQGFSQGAPLYVSTATPGGVTDVKPEAPNFAFQIGIVTRQGQPQNVTSGIVFISPIMQTDTNNLSNIVTTSAKVNDVLICSAVATPAGGGNPALPPVWTTDQLTRLYYTNTPLAVNAGQQIISSNFDTTGSKVIYLPISSGNSTITLSSPKPIADLTASDYGRQLWLHNVGNANITIPRAGGGSRNVALEGGTSQTLLPGSIIKLLWINPGSGQAYWLQTDKIVTSS
jgi:hypothetical protein